jgi:hypothetical protein
MLPANDASCLFVELQGGLEVVRLCRTRGSGRGLTAQAARSEPTRKKSSNWCQRRCVRIAAWSGEKAGAAKRDLRSDGPAGPAGASVADAAVQAFTLAWDGSGFPSRPVSQLVSIWLCLTVFAVARTSRMVWIRRRGACVTRCWSELVAYGGLHLCADGFAVPAACGVCDTIGQ